LPLFEQALAKMQQKPGPDHPETLHLMNSLAIMYQDTGRPDKALPLFEQVLAKSQKTDTLTLMGINALRHGKSDIAIKAFRRCIELQPDAPRAHDLLGHALWGQGKHDEAIAAFAKVLQLEPGNAGVQNHIGRILLSQGKRDEAAAAFRKTIDMEHSRAGAAEDLGTALVTLGLILLQQKKYADAEPLLRECLAVRTKRMPDDWL